MSYPTISYRIGHYAKKGTAQLTIGVILTLVSVQFVNAPIASAHARCDGQRHTHWHWTTSQYEYWKSDGFSARVHVRWGKDYYWAYASDQFGDSHANRCYW